MERLNLLLNKPLELYETVSNYLIPLVSTFNGTLFPYIEKYNLLKITVVALILLLTLGGYHVLGKMRKKVACLTLPKMLQFERLKTSKFPLKGMGRALTVVIQKISSILFFILQLWILYLGAFLVSQQWNGAHWATILYALKLILMNCFVLTLYYQFHQMIQRNQLQVAASIYRAELNWIRFILIRRLLKQSLILGIRVLQFAFTAVLLAYYADVLDARVLSLQPLLIPDRIGGVILVWAAFYFRETLKSFYRELIQSVKRLALYLSRDVTYKRMHVITNAQVAFMIQSAGQGIVKLMAAYSVLGIVQLSIRMICLNHPPSVVISIGNALLHSITLVFLIRFFLWHKQTSAAFPEKIAILSRLLKIGLNIDKKSPFNAVKFDPAIGLSLKLFYWGVVGLVIYSGFGIVLRIIPATQQLSQLLFVQLMSPILSAVETILGYIPNFIIIALISIAANYCMNFAKFFFNEIAEGHMKFQGFHKDFAIPTYQIVRFLIIVFSIIFIFPYVPGSQSPAFRGVSVLLGVLFSLGSSSIVSNIMAGIMITYMRPFKLGDRVKIADTVGDVVEKNLLVTRIKTIKNIYVAVPNAQILSTHITNFSFSSAEVPIILHSQVTIGYDVPWKTVHRLLIEAAQKTPHILETPMPFVLQTALTDFSVTYEINAYTKTVSQMALIYSHLHENIQTAFSEEKIEIMSPNFHVVRQSDKPAIPDAV